MSSFFKITTLVVLLSVTAACGSAAGSSEDVSEDISGNPSLDPKLSPFEAVDSTDAFAWGYFIRPPYRTTEISELPIQIYLAGFTDEEINNVYDGIDMANDAVGFDVFEVVDEWQAEARVIYKVEDISFDVDSSVSGIDDYSNVIGYTYSRNIYVNGLTDAGRVVTDFAIEIRADHVTKYVVAHELGHAMGIQAHALIDYDHDTTTELEPFSLMSATININPTLDDYEYMMGMQGDILLEYMRGLGVNF